MRIIPVIDLKGGQVVRAVAGRRDDYRPVQSVLCEDSSPRSIARAFVDQLAATAVYVADLDAIGGNDPSWNDLRAISEVGLKLWVDAGTGDIDRVRELLKVSPQPNRFHRVIIGLESLAEPRHLEQIAEQLGPDKFIFSLDLLHGRPKNSSNAWKQMEPLEIASMAVELGFTGVIVLDLAHVGRGTGIATEELCRDIRRRHADVELISGGGIRGLSDIQRLGQAGCSALLVSSALHNGKISPRDCKRFG